MKSVGQPGGTSGGRSRWADCQGAEPRSGPPGARSSGMRLDFSVGSCLYWNEKGTVLMTQNRRSRQQLYTQIDVGQPGAAPQPQAGATGSAPELVAVLREILAAQDRQNELLEELVGQLNAAQRQRANELGQWKQANPELARNCRVAAEALSKVQTEYLANLTEEINENFEALRDGEFMLNEFVDRFGPRVAHLNGLLQVLSQLSATGDPANASNTP